jgi:quinol monooxygenase YgiN
MYGLFGKLRAAPGRRDELAGFLLRGAEALRAAAGCHLYVVGLAEDDADGIWVMEAWESREAHQASLSLAAVQEVIAAARPIIAGFGERFEFTPLGGKGLE